MKKIGREDIEKALKKKKTDVNPESDSLDSHPEFLDQMADMQEQFFEENNPEFAELMKRFDNVDESPAKED